MEQNLCKNWQIVYGEYSSIEKQAVNFLSGELCKSIARVPGVYTLYVVPCVREGDADPGKNTIVLAAYEESAAVRENVAEEEIPRNGWLIRTRKDCGRQWIFITARKRENLYYAAASFVDDFLVKYAPVCGSLAMPEKFFEYDIPDRTAAFALKTETRSIFTWGHPLNDYRQFIRDTARLKVNRLIIWNDFAPINAREIMDFAHEFGIRVLWGFEWGWGVEGSAHIRSLDDGFLEGLKGRILEKFEREYRDISEDGIYFQSFTEREEDNIGGWRISEAVVKLVNEASGALLERYPQLNIVFGLHATSVQAHLEDIEKTDPRVEILWEDWGAFPSHYLPDDDAGAFDALTRATAELLKLRGGKKLGFLFKGFMVLDWSRFEYQQGPFVLGENPKAVTENDGGLRRGAWRVFQAGWIQCGENARKIAEQICAATGGKAEIGMAGCFDGGMWAAEALCAEIIADPFREYPEILRTALSKTGVRFA